MTKKTKKKRASRASPKKASASRKTTRTLKAVYGYADSPHAEEWHGANSRKGAEDYARELAEDHGGEGWICPGMYPSPASFVPAASTIIEHMVEAALDEGCPDFIDDPFEFKKGAEKALDRLLEAWARKYGKSNFWTQTGEPICIVRRETPRHGGTEFDVDEPAEAPATNALVDAARGRDESGVNEDEARATAADGEPTTPIAAAQGLVEPPHYSHDVAVLDGGGYCEDCHVDLSKAEIVAMREYEHRAGPFTVEGKPTFAGIPMPPARQGDPT